METQEIKRVPTARRNAGSHSDICEQDDYMALCGTVSMTTCQAPTIAPRFVRDLVGA